MGCPVNKKRFCRKTIVKCRFGITYAIYLQNNLRVVYDFIKHRKKINQSVIGTCRYFSR